MENTNQNITEYVEKGSLKKTVKGVIIGVVIALTVPTFVYAKGQIDRFMTERRIGMEIGNKVMAENMANELRRENAEYQRLITINNNEIGNWKEFWTQADNRMNEMMAELKGEDFR